MKKLKQLKRLQIVVIGQYTNALPESNSESQSENPQYVRPNELFVQSTYYFFHHRNCSLKINLQALIHPQ